MLGQQITLKAATQLAARIVSAAGAPVAESVDLPGLTHAFPRPQRLNGEILDSACRRQCCCAQRRAIAGVAAAISADEHLFDPRRDLAEAVARLRNLPGIGEWTAQYIAMRALGETDAFLAGDVGVQRRFAAQRSRRPAPCRNCSPAAEPLATVARVCRPAFMDGGRGHPENFITQGDLSCVYGLSVLHRPFCRCCLSRMRTAALRAAQNSRRTRRECFGCWRAHYGEHYGCYFGEGPAPRFARRGLLRPILTATSSNRIACPNRDRRHAVPARGMESLAKNSGRNHDQLRATCGEPWPQGSMPRGRRRQRGEPHSHCGAVPSRHRRGRRARRFWQRASAKKMAARPRSPLCPNRGRRVEFPTPHAAIMIMPRLVSACS